MPKTRKPQYQLAYPACAKLNLTLDILGRRDDGYHEIMTVMQTIDLCDRLIFTPLPDERETIELHCGRASLQSEANLVVRAARAIQEEVYARTGDAPAVSIELRKRIPVAAGLGGGSSDAARTLMALNEAWNANLTMDELARIAAMLGSDVPFFLYGGTTLAEGRGEILTALPSPPSLWVVLMRPPIHIPDKTRQLYSALKPSDYSDGTTTRALVELLRSQDKGIRRGVDKENIENSQSQLSPSSDIPVSLTPDWWKQWLNRGNTFAPIWDRIAPRMAIYRTAMLDAGASLVLLSGAGPTIYSLCTTEVEAHVIQSALRERGMNALLARFSN